MSSLKFTKSSAMMLSACIAMTAPYCVNVSASEVTQQQSLNDKTYTIKGGSLTDTLNTLAQAASLNLSANPDLINHLDSAGINGKFSIEQAFSELLTIHHLEAVNIGANNYTIRALPSSKDSNLNTLIITGEKLSRSLQDTNVSVKVIEGDKVDSNQQRSVYQALESTANVANDIAGLPSIRGVAGSGPTTGVFTFITGARPRVATTVDGVSQSWAGQRYLELGLWDVEQVEVLRGSQSTTQGRSTLAGAIVVKTKDPSFESENAIRLGYENNDDKYSLSAMISEPIIEDELAIRVSAEGVTGNGYIDYSLPSNATPSWDPSEIDRLNIRTKLLWEPQSIPELSAKLSYSHSKQKGEYLNTIEQVTNSNCENLADTIFCGITSNTRRTDSSSDAIVADINYEISDELNSHTSYARSESVSRFEQSNGRLDLRQDETSDTFETRLLYNAAENDNNGVLGFYYFNRNQELDAGPNTFIGDDKVSTFALYADSSIALSNNLDILLGGRIEHESQDRDVLAWPTRPIESRLLTNISETMFLPKVGFAYQLNQNTKLGFTARKGYSPGGGAIDFTTNEYYEFDKEEVMTYELSSRSKLFDQKVSFNTNLFYSEFKDYQGLLNRRLVNIDKGRSFGLELDANAQLSTTLSVNGGIGLLKTEITDAGTDNEAINGNEFNSAPKFSANIGFSKQLNKGYFVGANVAHTASYFSDIENDGIDKAGNYTLVNVHTGYKKDDFQVRAYVNNLTDEEVYYSASTNRFGQSVKVGQSRTFGVSVDFQF